MESWKLASTAQSAVTASTAQSAVTALTAQSAVTALVVGAMTLAGVATGALLFGRRAAEAQEPPHPRAFRECILARQDSLATNDEGHLEILRTSRIVWTPPGGWQPVGGGGVDAHGQGTVVFCR